MDELFAAYGDEEKPTNKKKSKGGVVRVMLPLSMEELVGNSKVEDIEKKVVPPASTAVDVGKKRTSIADLLPPPKAKQQRITSIPKVVQKIDTTQTTGQKHTPVSVTPQNKSPFSTTTQNSTNTNDTNDTKEEDDVIGPQMPCAADLVYYESYYEQPAQEQETGNDTVAEIANCGHIPELERNIIVGKKRRGETAVFIDINQKDLRKVSDWDRDSHEFYTSTAALQSHNYNRNTNQLSTMVSHTMSNTSNLDARLARIRQSKANVKAKYGW